jgi:SAM-dependent methyltransferase
MNCDNSPQCPGCESTWTGKSGPIRDALLTLDAKSASPFASADLYICYSCGLGFRFPLCSHEALHQIYSQTSDTLWGSRNATVRRDWNFAESFISSLPGRPSILDVGCYTGAFLQRFKDHACYGVEPSSQAADRARASGITIVSDNYATLQQTGHGFDIITCFDVIEHIASPKDFMQALGNQLSSGGFLLIATGNFHHWTFRLMKHRYYYCSHPEHIVFYSPAILDFYAKRLGLQRINCYRFVHGRSSYVRIIHQSLLNALYLCAPGIIARLRSFSALLDKTSARPVNTCHPPFWGAVKNHFASVYRKL